MWPTRKGAWRSRAGGVYLPPEANIERQGSPSLSPARWMYPEEFNRPLQTLGGTIVIRCETVKPSLSLSQFLFSVSHPTAQSRRESSSMVRIRVGRLSDYSRVAVSRLPRKARRSPSYTRFEREEISSSSSSSSSSTIPRPKKRRKAPSASSSPASRPSPTYQPDE